MMEEHNEMVIYSLGIYTDPMHVVCAFEELFHVELNLTGLQLHAVILEEPGEIMVQVWEDHVHRKWCFLASTCEWNVNTVSANGVFKLTSHDKHVKYVDYARMTQRLQYLDLPQGSHRHAFLFVVHQNALESNGLAS